MIRRRRRRLGAVLSLVALAGVVAACNTLVGLDRDYVVINGDAAGGGPDGFADTTSSSDGSPDGVATTDGFPPPGGDANTDGDAAATVDAADAADAAFLDADATPPAKLIHCGSASITCSLPGQTCCSKIAGGYYCPSLTECDCQPANTCTRLELKCDDITDCNAGEVCCGRTTTDNDELQDSYCTTTCPIPFPDGGPSGFTQLCDPNNNQCPTPDLCSPFKFNGFPGVGRCW